MGNILTTSAKTKRISRHVVIMGGMCSLMNQNVFAAALFEHIVQPYVETHLTYDSNILRLPKGYTPVMSGNKNTTSSFIKQLKAGLAVKWQISQQEVIADVNVNQNWYSTFNELNYTGYNLLGQWNWQIGSRLKGEISYNNEQSLSNFSQINRLINNVQKTQLYIANGSYEIFPDWFLRAGFSRNMTSFPTALRQQNNLNEDTGSFGLRYGTALDNVLGFNVIIANGKYPKRDDTSIFDNAYTRTSYVIEGRWHYSVKTEIKAELGYTSQKFKHITERNFSDITANADIRWDITSKSAVLLSAWRKINAADNLTATFVLYQGVMITPMWTWSETPKIKVELPISYEQQLSLGTLNLGNAAANSQSQQANQSMIRLNLSYTPIQNVEMTAFSAYETRHSNVQTSNYQDYSVGMTMKVSF